MDSQQKIDNINRKIIINTVIFVIMAVLLLVVTYIVLLDETKYQYKVEVLHPSETISDTITTSLSCEEVLLHYDFGYPTIVTNLDTKEECAK